MNDKLTAGFFCTGVFATPKEVAAIKAEFAAPAISHGGPPGRGMPDPPKLMHRLALAHGLREIHGFYGVDFRDGEFIRMRDDDMPGEPVSTWGDK